jgi:hypothetical protein
MLACSMIFNCVRMPSANVEQCPRRLSESCKREITELEMRVAALEAALMHVGCAVAKLEQLHEGIEVPDTADHHEREPSLQ